MEITEVRIKLMEGSDDRLQAFCSITFDDCFVIRDLKIIEGTSGPFVAMPSRKLTAHCPQCRAKNHLRSAYCNHCGGKLKDDRPARDSEGRARLYADIAHPINAQCREMIQARVIAEYRAEQERATQPGYVSRYDDDYESLDYPDSQATDGREPAFAHNGASNQVAKPSATIPSCTGTSSSAATGSTAEEVPSSSASGDSSPRVSSQVQPPATEPRPPHRTPSNGTQSAAARRPARSSSNDDFGAGIF